MTLTLKKSGELMVPPSVRRRAGLKAGYRLEFNTSRGVVTISRVEDEYTPEQRVLIDARLAEAAEDVKAGRVYGPFATHEEFVASLKAEGRKLCRSARRTAKRG